MKAAVIQAIGSPLVVEDIPDPDPGQPDLILKVGACGICGTDLHMSENTDPNVGWRMMHPGCVMGHEFAGEVVEAGGEAKRHWHQGDRVTALPWIGCGECAWCKAGRGYRCPKGINRGSAALPGAYAEYCRVGARETIRLPDGVSFREGALVEPLAVGYRAFRRARVQGDDRLQPHQLSHELRLQQTGGRPRQEHGQGVRREDAGEHQAHHHQPHQHSGP